MLTRLFLLAALALAQKAVHAEPVVAGSSNYAKAQPTSDSRTAEGLVSSSGDAKAVQVADQNLQGTWQVQNRDIPASFRARSVTGVAEQRWGALWPNMFLGSTQSAMAGPVNRVVIDTTLSLPRTATNELQSTTAHEMPAPATAMGSSDSSENNPPLANLATTKSAEHTRGSLTTASQERRLEPVSESKGVAPVEENFRERDLIRVLVTAMFVLGTLGTILTVLIRRAKRKAHRRRRRGRHRKPWLYPGL